MSQQAFTTLTLRRLPSGETVQIALSANRSLTILVDTNSRKQTPTLSEQTPIILTPNVYATTGNAATLTDVHWYMNNYDCVVNYSSICRVDNNTGKLTIFGSPIGPVISDNNLAPITIRFTAKAVINGHSYTVEKMTSLDFPEVSENSYWGAIECTKGTTLDEETSETTLTPHLYLNAAEVTTGYNVKWYKTGGNLDGSDMLIDSTVSGKWTLTGNNLTVKRDGVDSAAHFEAHFFVSNNEVEAEGVSIVDIADNVQVILEGDTYIQEGQDANINIRAVDTRDQSTLTITSLNVTVTDSLRQRTFNKAYYQTSISNGQGTFTMNEGKWHVPYGDQQQPDQWAICGTSSAADTLTTDITKATKCEVILLVDVTV